MAAAEAAAATPNRPRGRPAAGDREDTRHRVLLAARDAFAVRGYSGASMRSIAAEAGVTAMALYNYAPSKAALLGLVWGESIDALYAGFGDAAAGRTSLADEIDAVLDHVGAALAADPQGALFAARFLVERGHPDLAGVDLHSAPYADFFGAITERAVARGELSRPELGHFVAFVSTLLWGCSSVAAIDAGSLPVCVDAAKVAVRRFLSTG